MTFVLHTTSLLLLFVAPVSVTADGGHWVQFTMASPGMSVPNYVVNLQQEDGHGWYSPSADGNETTRVPISAGAATLTKVFAPQGHLNDCETHLKHIANTGKKTLKYQDGDNATDCTFNYSDNDTLNAASTTFQAIAETMRLGTQLQHDHRFDRLGLDAEIDTLIDELKSGMAVEVVNIAPTLKSLAQDDRVMERVRRKSARLLEDAGVDSK